jgi:acyl-CoA reductase-like NAD-dependent aldehyde dehydrogenase
MAMTTVVEHLIDGQWHSGPVGYTTTDPYKQQPYAEVPACDAGIVQAAVGAAVAATKSVAATPARERAAVLGKMAAAIRAQADGIARAMSEETGKPIRDALMEVSRSAQTFELSAQEAVRICGEQVPMDSSEIGAGKLGMTLRVPVGVVAAITPFNAPVNLCSHKIGPALAAGNPVVLKPAPQASGTVHRYVQALQSAGIPAGWLNVIYGYEAGAQLVRDPGVRFISFTGSGVVGEAIRQASGLRRVALELGGNGNTIVCADAAWEGAAQACARNSMRLAGQSCISVQNVWVHASLANSFIERMATEIRRLKTGAPLDPGTDVGPVISRESAERIERTVAEANRAGAALVLGAGRDGALVQPTMLAGTPVSDPAVAREIFGPVVNVLPFESLEDTVACINDGPFGLQAGIYTESMRTAMTLIRELDMGAVIVNGTSTWRSDQAPYGGVKASGIGREGPKYAIREMTDERFVVFNM